MKANIIKSFSVYGLFGTNDVHIPFDENIKILAGENGIGKTQILNLFYYTLKKNFLRLSDFPFKKIILTFNDDKVVEISKDNVDDLGKVYYKHPIVRDLIDKIGISQFENLKNQFLSNKNKESRYKLEEIYEDKLRRIFRIPFQIIRRTFEELEMIENKTSNFNLNKCEELINTFIEDKKIDILYFPTFRRIEEDLHILGYNEDELLSQENALIKFGMDDVQSRFKKIETDISKLNGQGFTNFTKDILKVVIDTNTNTNIFERINEDDLEIIFARVGNELGQEVKDTVKEIVKNKDFKNHNPILAFLIQKLVEQYEKQKEIDNSVKFFRDVCNKYLINKKIFYDESAIKIYVKSDITGEEILLSKLSSGEKQIISIFSKIYLANENQHFIMLFDEPELSLSMLWQQQLLPDVINSKKCDFLLAVTHSPFIFDNELDKYAVGLSEYIREPKLAVNQ
ncbi:MAG: ATP-binding protein [Microscillaceae bacterium]|jgi:predicted ATPase|nr:ATP-binding protein [Microscillaceae bacterium]